MMSRDELEFRQREHTRMVSRANRTAWMAQNLVIPSALGKRIRERVRRR